MNRQLVIRNYSDRIDNATEIISSSIPMPSAEQVVIRNQFVGINAIYDRELYRGNVPYIPVQFPMVFGVESVGIVETIGKDVKKLKVGDPVSLVKVGTAYQQFICVSQELPYRIPSLRPQYLAINPTGISALIAIDQLGNISNGDVVVISAAAGGLGHFLVQLCKERGAEVIGICGSEKKVKMLESLNCCDRIVNYRKEDLQKVLNTDYQDAIDVAFDSVGRDMFDNFLENLAPEGRLIVMGMAKEFADKQFEMQNQPRVYEKIYWKGASIHCFMNHLYKHLHKEIFASMIEQYHNGKFDVVLDDNSFTGIDQIVSASKYLLEGKSCGKVYVDLS